MLKKVILVIVLAAPIAAWAFVKPLRVLAPQLEGLECEGMVCVEDPARRAQATAMYSNAVKFVQTQVGAMETTPRALFCSTRACSEKFGLEHRNAYNVGLVALVISDRSWYPFFVRHELIHHLQNERLGSLRTWLFKPVWFREGMAYSLSKDPRRPLVEPLEGYRAQFEAWYEEVGPERLWAEAERLYR